MTDEKQVSEVKISPHDPEYIELYSDTIDKAFRIRGDGQTFADLILAAAILGVSMGVEDDDAREIFKGIWLAMKSYHKDATDEDREAFKDWSASSGFSVPPRHGRMN